VVRGWWAASYVVLWFVVLALSLLVVALARQVSVLHLRLGPRGALEIDDEGPPLGEAPEPVEALDLDGEPVTVGGPGDPRLVLFVSPACPVCREVLPSLPAVARETRTTPVVALDDGVPEARAAYGSKRFGSRIVAAPGLHEAFRVPGTPYALVLDRLGVVQAKGTVNNLEQMEGLVDTARRRLEEMEVTPEWAH
jgi:methylamine dehydrogenase accessory protein MauD